MQNNQKCATNIFYLIKIFFDQSKTHYLIGKKVDSLEQSFRRAKASSKLATKIGKEQGRFE